MKQTKRPQPLSSYTTRQILTELYLRDSPHLIFTYEGGRECIQLAHVTDDELLAVPGLADIMWTYLRETHEWIPLFHLASDLPDLLACVEMNLDDRDYGEPRSEWRYLVGPKGHPFI